MKVIFVHLVCSFHTKAFIIVEFIQYIHSAMTHYFMKRKRLNQGLPLNHTSEKIE